MRYRVLYFGSDLFSCSTLKRLVNEWNGGNLISHLHVVTKKPQRSGRNLKQLVSLPVQRLAEEIKLPFSVIDDVYADLDMIKRQDINLIVASSFGEFVPSSMLSQATFGGINLHPSLLPLYRGPAPIHWALLDSAEKTGATVQKLHPRHFDRGQIFGQIEYPIPPKCTYQLLHDSLAQTGADLVVDVLKRGPDWNPIPPAYEPTYARKLTKDDAVICFQEHTSEQILLRKRVFPRIHAFGVSPEGRVFRFILPHLEPSDLNLQPGELSGDGLELHVGAKIGSIKIPSLIPENQAEVSGREWLKRRQGNINYTFN